MEYALFYYNENNHCFVLLQKDWNYKTIFDRLNQLYETSPDLNFCIFCVCSDRGGVVC